MLQSSPSTGSTLVELDLLLWCSCPPPCLQLMVPDPDDVGKSYDAQSMFNKDFKDLTARERKTLRDAKARRCGPARQTCSAPAVRAFGASSSRPSHGGDGLRRSNGCGETPRFLLACCAHLPDICRSQRKLCQAAAIYVCKQSAPGGTSMQALTKGIRHD